MERVDSAAVEFGVEVLCETVGDKDIEWTKIIDDIDNKMKNTKCMKIDDINHALGVVYDCVEKAKHSLPKTELTKSRLSVNFADHLYRGIQRGLIAKPDSYSWNDMVLGVNHYFAGNTKGDHDECPEWCPVRQAEAKGQTYAPALAYGKYLDRNRDPIHAKGYKYLLEELRSKFPDEQFIRLHGNPRSQDNENLHSMATKKFSKATRPPGLKAFTGIIASAAGIKNWGRGFYLQRVLSAFGSVRNSHSVILNKLQLQSIYNWYRSRTDKLKIKRAVSKKKYQEKNQKRQSNTQKKAKQYAKNCDKATTKSFKSNSKSSKRCRDNNNCTNNVNPNERQKTIPNTPSSNASSPQSKPSKTYDYKYQCAKCGRKYKYKGSYDTHTKENYKNCKGKELHSSTI